MGLFSWLWDIFGGLFSASGGQEMNSVMSQEGYKDLSTYREEIPRYVKEFKRLEQKNCQQLSKKSQQLFKKLERNPQIKEYATLVVNYVRKVEGVVKEKNPKTQLLALQNLYTQYWTPLSSNLARDFNNDPEILKLREEIDKCFRLLMQETSQDIHLSSLLKQ
jgi:hypothetical protein